MSEWIWRPIAEYRDGDWVLLRGDDRTVFGMREGDGWAEVIDNPTIFQPGFEPAEFAVVPDYLLADLEGG